MAASEYSIWRAVELAMRLAVRANEEVRLLARLAPNTKAIATLIDEALDARMEMIAAKVADIPVPQAKPGVGIKNSFIDRDGCLVQVYDDGRTENVGPVVGKSVDTHALAEMIADAMERQPKPKDGIDGRDGIGFDDLAMEHDGERTFTLRATAGERTKQCSITVPLPIDRGVWAPGRYEKGDTVTFAGSMFIAQDDTDEKPESGASWRLAVKRGRDGKDFTGAAPKPIKLPPADE